MHMTPEALSIVTSLTFAHLTPVDVKFDFGVDAPGIMLNTFLSSNHTTCLPTMHHNAIMHDFRPQWVY